MPILRDAWHSLRQNQALVFTYLGGIVVILVLLETLFTYVLATAPEGPIPSWLYAARYGALFAFNGVAAAWTAVLFARLGREIDKPLWKCPSDVFALERFFTPWLAAFCIEALLAIAYFEALRSNYEGAALMGILLMLATSFRTPVVATIMYARHWRWTEASEIMAPLFRQFAMAVPAIFLGLGEFALFIVASAMAPAGIPYANVAPQVLMALLMMLSFAAMWRVLMIDRDTPRDEDDSHFDL